MVEKRSEPRISSAKKSAVSSRCMIWFSLFMHFLLFIVGFLVIIYSPSKLVTILILSFTTTLPVQIYVSTFNILCYLASRFRDLFPSAISDAFYRGVKLSAAFLGVLHGKIIHGYEVHGKENLPRTTGGLVVYHHGLLTYDVFYLFCGLYLLDGTAFGGILNRQLVPVIRSYSKCFNYDSERSHLVENLKKGQLCTVAPGGGIEGMFSKDYELVWNGRVGFAEVAKECRVPVIPMFTVNSQQAMPFTTFGFYDFFMDLFKKTGQYPFLALFCFPVKLRTYFGKPLYCGNDETPTEFAERVKAAIYELRDKHQRQPGNFIIAILERFGYKAFSEEGHTKKKA